MKRKKKNTSLYVIVGILIVALAGVALYQYSAIQDLSKANALYEMELSNNQQTVYVAKKLINAGDVITDNGDKANVERQLVYTGLESFNYISAEDIGARATVPIASGIPIMYNMISSEEVDNDTREYEIAVANLTTDQCENDVIDIRIMFPNGEDYVVLAKKQMINLNLEGSVFTSNLNEEEILRLSSAIVDAYTTTGARIYTTRYVESNIQEAAKPNYPVRETTLALINSDPNILTKATATLNLQARLSLEQRLGSLSAEMLDAVSSGLGLTDTAKSSVIGTGQQATQGEVTE